MPCLKYYLSFSTLYLVFLEYNIYLRFIWFKSDCFDLNRYFFFLFFPSNHTTPLWVIQSCSVQSLRVGKSNYAITRLGVPSIAGRLLKVIETCWAYRPILHCITYWVWVHRHWLLRNADKILKYEAEAPLVATDVCDHYQIALGLRRIRNQKLWCTKNRQNSDCGLPNSTHLTK